MTSTEGALISVKPFELPNLKLYKRIANKFVIDEIALEQDYYWTQEWQEGESEADKDIKEKNWDTFSSSKDAINYLHELRDDANKPH